MRKILNTVSLICICIFLCYLKTHSIFAVDYQFGFSLDPPFSHFIVKPNFKNIGTEFTISNKHDPLYLQLRFDDYKDFYITIYDIDADKIRPIDSKNNTFLLLSNSSKHFRVEISNRNGKLDPRDYSIDLSAVFTLVQTPKNVQKPVLLEPKIHKYIVLGVTEDGSMSFDPKIALFQNVNGHFSLLTTPQSLLVTIQNRGNHLFATSGTITLAGPNHFEEKYTIPLTYILANSQKNLTVEGQGDHALIRLPPTDLRSGQYTALIDLAIPGSNTPHLFGQTSFWLISPLYGVASVVFCLIMILVIFLVGLQHT